MSNIVYRRLNSDDLDIFIKIRINQLLEEGAKESCDLEPYLRDYYERHMLDNSFISWIAIDNNKIIGTSGMSIVEKPPYFQCKNGKIGLLSSMFTDKNYRRKDIAKSLLDKVISDAKSLGCACIQITASDMGVLLYTNYGFKKNNNFMQYNIC